MNMQPPKWADKFLSWYCNPDLLEEIQGDAHELYYQRLKQEGKSLADLKYAWDVIRFCRWSNIRKSQNDLQPGYLQVIWNLNFKLAFRNAFRNKVVFSVKMLGISLCLAFALLIAGFVIHEFTFDRYHPAYEKIFRIGTKVTMHGALTHYAVSPLALADGLADEIPEVQNAVRLMYLSKPVFAIEDKLFNGDVALAVNEEFLKVFSFDFIHGVSSALDEPNKIVLTEATATKYFGGQDPVGQVIGMGWTDVEVAAVIKDVPQNFHLKFDALISWETFDFRESWGNINAYTYIQLNAEADMKQVAKKVNDTFVTHREDIEEGSEDRASDAIQIEPIIENVADIHLGEFLDEDIADKRNATNLYILISVSFLFLITGIINFLNLSLAELTTNLRKISILQVFGGSTASHGKVVVTNILFSIIIMVPLTAFFASVGLWLSERYLSIHIERSVFASPIFVALAIGFILAFVAALKINSIVLSKASDLVHALKGRFSKGQTGYQAREFLVGTQLSFSIIMFALIAIIVDQFQFVNAVDKGFEDKNTIVIKMRHSDFGSAQALQESVRKLNGVKGVDGGSFYLDNIETKEFFEVETKAGRKKMLVAYMNCGYNYLDVLGIKILKGRNFSQQHNDEYGTYLVNAAAAKEFGWQEPVGQRIWGPLGSDRSEGEVIGIVKDFNFASLHSKIEPLIIFPVSEGWGISYVYVKTNPIKPASLIAQIEQQYKAIYDDVPFEWEYLDAKYASLYKEDQEMKNVFQVGLVISILVSCLGIFSMSALLVVMRTKEMGIRKVIGANQLQLFFLHVKSFVKFVLIAVLIAWPVTYVLSNHWLDNFAYRISLSVWYFIVPCLAAFFIVLMTSGYHGWKSSRVNPVDILKDE
jgi:putative ABC transport system permease protein